MGRLLAEETLPHESGCPAGLGRYPEGLAKPSIAENFREAQGTRRASASLRIPTQPRRTPTYMRQCLTRKRYADK